MKSGVLISRLCRNLDLRIQETILTGEDGSLLPNLLIPKSRFASIAGCDPTTRGSENFLIKEPCSNEKGLVCPLWEESRDPVLGIPASDKTWRVNPDAGHVGLLGPA